MPVVGSYVTPLRQHVSGSDAGPPSASNLPPGLTLNRVISDYLRAMGKFILRHLQEAHFRSDLSMEDVQWCVTVPSIWSHNPWQQMESSMVDAGLVLGGSIGMNANAHPVIMTRLLEEWERGAGRSHKFIDLASELGVAWEEHNERLGLLHPWYNDTIELSYTDMENILTPIVEANLDFVLPNCPKQVASE
ncbi:unnamed protein product [Sphagnum tenellum]